MGQHSILSSFMLLISISLVYRGVGNSHGHLNNSVCSAWDATLELKGQSLDRLGESMLFSGDGSVLAVTGGGLITTQSGFVRLFETNQWRQLGNQIPGTNKNDDRRRSVALSMNGRMVAFGERSSLSISGSILPGRVRVFQYSEMVSDWVQVGQELIEDGVSYFGQDVALSGDGTTLAIGSPGFDEEDIKIYRLENNNTIWSLSGTLDTPLDGDSIGGSVSLSNDGMLLAASDPSSDGTTSNDKRGKIHFYNFASSHGWTMQDFSIIGDNDFERIGQMIVLDSAGRTLAVTLGPTDGTDRAFARVYRLRDSQWKAIGNDIVGEIASGETGAGIAVSLARDGESVAVGSPGGKGKARVYRYQSSVDEWLLIGDETVGHNPGDQYGVSIAVSVQNSSANLAVGARFLDVSGNDNAGSVRLFDMDPNCFQEQFNLLRKEATVGQLALRLVGVQERLDQSAISYFESVSMELFDEFYEKNVSTIQGMVSKFSVVQQNQEALGGEVLHATVEFSVRMVYVQDSESNLTSNDLLLFPFNSSEFAIEYGNTLRQDDSFSGLQVPIDQPFFVEPTEAAPVSADGDGLNSTALIAGIVPGTIIAAVVIAVLLFRKFKADLPVGEVVTDHDQFFGNGDGALDAEVVLVDENVSRGGRETLIKPNDRSENRQDAPGFKDQFREAPRTPEDNVNSGPLEGTRVIVQVKERGPDYKAQVHP